MMFARRASACARPTCPRPKWQDDDAFVRVQVVDPDGYRVELFAYS
jgi:hypothetical protein